MPRWRFIARYLSKNGLESEKFPIFWKNVCDVFLELIVSLTPEIWTVGTSSKNLWSVRMK